MLIKPMTGLFILLILSGFASAGLAGWVGVDLITLSLRRRASRLA